MYFSRVRIESGALAQVRLLQACQGDLYAMHQLIWKLFPNDPDGCRTFLFRQEFEKEQLLLEDARRGLPIFYVVSEKQPIAVNGLLAVDLKEYRPKISISDRFTFKIRVNPIVAKKNDGKKNSIKHDVLMDAKYRAKVEGITDPDKIFECMKTAAIDWFNKKGKIAGFQLEKPENIEVTSYRQHLIRKKGSKEIKFSSVDLSGILSVNDLISFEKTLFNGFGSAKAFGCGLLLIKPYN